MQSCVCVVVSGYCLLICVLCVLDGEPMQQSSPHAQPAKNETAAAMEEFLRRSEMEIEKNRNNGECANGKPVW